MEKQIMYRAEYPNISKLEIIKKTEKQVVFLNNYGKEQREAIESSWSSWHETKEQAREWLIKQENFQLEQHQRGILYRQERILNIKKL